MSDEFVVGSTYYMPFWILMNYLDSEPPDPFVKVKLLRLTNTEVATPDAESVKFDYAETCTVEVLNGIEADTIPRSYLLHKDELSMWAKKLADWFVGFADREINE